MMIFLLNWKKLLLIPYKFLSVLIYKWNVNYTIITDITSGINFKRKGLSTILDSCLQNDIGEIVIAHKDRLCRFGFDLIEYMVTKAGGKITILDNTENKTSEQELTDDLLSIIHVFSCARRARRR